MTMAPLNAAVSRHGGPWQWSLCTAMPVAFGYTSLGQRILTPSDECALGLHVDGTFQHSGHGLPTAAQMPATGLEQSLCVLPWRTGTSPLPPTPTAAYHH